MIFLTLCVLCGLSGKHKYVGSYLFTAESAESAEMTEKERLNKDGIRRVVNDFPDSLRAQR